MTNGQSVRLISSYTGTIVYGRVEDADKGVISIQVRVQELPNGSFELDDEDGKQFMAELVADAHIGITTEVEG